MTLANWSFGGQDDQIENIQVGQYFESSRESGRGTFSVNASEVMRVFFVRYDERFSFISDLLGYATLSFNDDVYSISRVLPEPYPSNELFFAYDAQVDPLGPGVLDTESNLPEGTWTLAKVTAKYKPVPYHVLPDNQVDSEIERFVSRTYQVQTEFISIQGQMKFVQTQRALGRPPGRYVTKILKSMTFHGVPAKTDNPYSPPTFSNIVACAGRLNDAFFDVTVDNHPPGTCLFLAPECKLIMPRLDQATLTWDITYQFQIFDQGSTDLYTTDVNENDHYIGQNWVLDQANNRYDIITSNGNRFTGTRIYEEADLSSLFVIS